MVRWDSPLFTVPWSESDILIIELLWRAITEGNVKPPNAGTQAVGDLFATIIRATHILHRHKKRRLMPYILWNMFRPHLSMPL